jgi:5-methyltetrahydrofolate--homocysteine methyltransferase
MELEFKPDWEAAQARYLAWWNHGYFGRCALAVFAPKKNPPDRPAPPPAQSVEQQWYDLDWISAQRRYHMERTFYGGEALPIWSGGYPGHTGIPTFLGCPTRLDWETGWWDPILLGEEIEFRHLRIDRSCRDYRFAVELLQRGVAEMKGRGLVTIGAFGGCGDTLAALRGTERLLFDCIERPEQVRAADDFLMDMWFDHYDALYGIIREADEGSTCWFDLWSPGKFYAAQNDFAYNISPRMYRDLFLPSIRKQTEFLTHCVYHVDGIGNFVHVDALCELPRLHALQIGPGAGKPNALYYLETLKKVQKAGKNLWISLKPGEVRTALEILSARGLFISVWAPSEDEARELLRNAEKWSVDRG